MEGGVGAGFSSYTSDGSERGDLVTLSKKVHSAVAWRGDLREVSKAAISSLWLVYSGPLLYLERFTTGKGK